MSLTEQIKQKAKDIGFDLVGVTTAEQIERMHVLRFLEWLDDGNAGQMEYMQKNVSKRFTPAKLLAGAISVIVAAINYKREDSGEQKQVKCKTACYGCYEDYHSFIRGKLSELCEYIKEVAGSETKFKVCVDSVPLAEKALAVRGGLGFIGKNHLLVSEELGPSLLLGEIITTVELEADEPIDGGCGDCRGCIDSCPTGALSEDGKFDAGICISYLMIEHKGEIPEEKRAKIGNHIFGCDECIMACPFYKKAPACVNKDFKFFADRADIDPREILAMDEEQFKLRFEGSSIFRTGLANLKRNAEICIENTKKL